MSLAERISGSMQTPRTVSSLGHARVLRAADLSVKYSDMSKVRQWSCIFLSIADQVCGRTDDDMYVHLSFRM